MSVKSVDGAYQVRVAAQGEKDIFIPSVEVLFASLNEMFHNSWMGIMLTGMGGDGAKELTRLFKNNGHTLVEAEESCVVFGMPNKVIEMGGAEFILQEEEIIAKLLELTGRVQ